MTISTSIHSITSTRPHTSISINLRFHNADWNGPPFPLTSSSPSFKTDEPIVPGARAGNAAGKKKYKEVGECGGAEGKCDMISSEMELG